MKIPSLIAILAAATLLPASALTADDIAPDSLPGKTFVFTIETNFGLPVRSGGWKGTFGDAPGTDFTITNVSGNTVNRTASYSATSIDTAAPTTSITLPKVITSFDDITYLSLVVTGNKGTFTMNTFIPSGSTFTESSQTGSFILEDASTAPEISVKLGKAPLTDGSAAKISIGTAKTGKIVTKKFTVANAGTADLTGLAFNSNSKEFRIIGPGVTSLAPGKSTSFTVSFKPSAAGSKNAVIKIASNDADENPFDIKVTGTGLK